MTVVGEIPHASRSERTLLGGSAGTAWRRSIGRAQLRPACRAIIMAAAMATRAQPPQIPAGSGTPPPGWVRPKAREYASLVAPSSSCWTSAEPVTPISGSLAE